MKTQAGHRVTTQAQSREALAHVEAQHPEFADNGERLVYDEDGHLNAYQVAWGLHLSAAARKADRKAALERFRSRRSA